MVKSSLIVHYLLYVVLVNFCAFGQITFSKDWRPSGKRSLNSLMLDSDYGGDLRSALGYTRLAEVHLQSLLARVPRGILSPDRAAPGKPVGGFDDYAMRYYAASDDDKSH